VGKEGKIFYEKHKILLYKEDFEKFSEGLKDAVDYISNGNAIARRETALSEEIVSSDHSELSSGDFTNLDFEDLDIK